MNLALAKVHPNPNQPRKVFPREHIEQLAASIKKHGLLQPILVRPDGDGFEIIAGECRWRAHKLLGAKTIAATVQNASDSQTALRAMIENLQRHDMNPMEEARGYQTLIDAGYTPENLANELGLGPAIIRNRLVLLRLIPQAQKLVESGNLSVTMAWGVAQVPKEHQSRVLRDISSGRLKTVESVKHACFALRDAAQQVDAFDAPQVSKKDRAALTALESKINTVADLVSSGFKDGACVAAQRVDPDRVRTLADKITLMRKHLLQMEHDLRRASTQSEMRLAA